MRVKFSSQVDDCYHGFGIVNENFKFGEDCMCDTSVHGVYSVNSLGHANFNGEDFSHTIWDLDFAPSRGTIVSGTLDATRKTFAIGARKPVQIVGNTFRFFVSRCIQGDQLDQHDVTYESL
jgi:hypothetical protein